MYAVYCTYRKLGQITYIALAAGQRKPCGHISIFFPSFRLLFAGWSLFTPALTTLLSFNAQLYIYIPSVCIFL